MILLNKYLYKIKKKMIKRLKYLISYFFKWINSRFLCKHIMFSVPQSPHYFHEKCDKCGYEHGMGNFKL